ncbi:MULTISPECIES: ligand-binding sensor domain-containing protein [Chitinophagaceae]
MVKKVFCLVVILYCSLVVCGQSNTGIPDIRNYSRSEYKAGSQNWGIAQDNDGVMYFGNNEGLLSYDGNKWRLYSLPLKGNVRSLAISEDKIYIGGQQAIGYFQPGRSGDLEYHSLNGLIETLYRSDFADVWNVVVDRHRIFFRSNRHIFLYENGKIASFQSYNWSFLGKVGDKIYAFDDSRGLCQYVNGQWQVVLDKKTLPINVQISSLLLEGDVVWIVTYNNGIYKWKEAVRPFTTSAINVLKSQMIYGATPLSPDKIAFVTNLNGCVVTDTAGRFINRFAHKEGLQNNNVICSYVDRDKNLWLGLGDGIDIVEYNKPIRSISPGEDGPVAGYAAAVYQSELFLGTATGVYKTRYGKDGALSQSFEKLPHLSGQILTLKTIRDKLFIGQYRSAFTYSNGTLNSINKKPTGFWNFNELAGKDYVIAGTYNGLHYFKWNGNGIEDIGTEALFESAKYVAVNGNTVWAVHPYKGLYRIDLSEKGLPFKTISLGLPSFLSHANNHLFKVEDRIIVTSDKGIFEWDAASGTFIPSRFFIQIFGNRNIEYLKENARGDYWFVENGKMGIAIHEGNSSYKVLYFPELNGRLQSGENVNIDLLSDSGAMVAAEKGFFYVNYAEYKSYVKDFNLLIRSFQIQMPKKDSILFGGYETSGMEMPVLAYKFNSVLFSYSVPIFGYASSIQYSYRLDGFDQGWSNWTEKTEKNYTNLPPGQYRFFVKARDVYTGKIKESSFDFIVLAPWYRTTLAYILYIVLLLVGIYLFSRFQHRRYSAIQTKKLQEQEEAHEKRRKELELQHNLEQEKKEHQLTVMTNEKLAMELEVKNTTIAANAMLLIQKGEFLSKVKKDLSTLLVDASAKEKPVAQIKKIIKAVDLELNNKEDWDKFASHFDTVHKDYLKILKENYPQLTYGDLKLCALLRLGMSSKEIAGVFNISLKGVEVSRYRLRKKLHLEEDESLFDFLTK